MLATPAARAPLPEARYAPPRRLLLIAFHYPPANASGTLRSLKFTRYLPQFGWEASVLTAPAECHESVDPRLVEEIPPQVSVHRAFCVSSQRAFSVRGHYPAFTAVPDRYISWLPFGVWQGLRAVRRERIDALLSTSPVQTAHLIAYLLNTVTGLPWVADFRDPWGGNEPRGRIRLRVERWMESCVVRRANQIVGTTPEFIEDLCQRVGSDLRHKAVAIYNGYDDADFGEVDLSTTSGAQFVITHAGQLNPGFRHPGPFLRAVGLGLGRGTLPTTTRIRLLGSGPMAGDASLQQVLVDLGLQARVEVVERMPYGDALRAMSTSSALLLLQGGQGTRAQIPNKAFEYLRLGRPILCLATPNSATARVMREFDGVFLAEPDDVEGIARALNRLLDAWRRGQRVFDRQANGVSRYSRSEAARKLAEVLDRFVPQTHPAQASAAAPNLNHHDTIDEASVAR